MNRLDQGMRSSAPRKPPVGGGRRRAGKLLAWLSWLYVVSLLVLWGLITQVSDRWWPATALMYFPRPVWGLPLILLVPAAALLRWRLLGVQLVALALVVWPIMGLCLPWRNV